MLKSDIKAWRGAQANSPVEYMLYSDFSTLILNYFTAIFDTLTTPVSDQDRILCRQYQHNIEKISDKNEGKYQLKDC